MQALPLYACRTVCPWPYPFLFAGMGIIASIGPDTNKKINCCELTHSVFTSIYIIYHVQSTTKNCFNKKAVLSQRRPRDAPYMSLPWKFSRVPDYVHTPLCPKFLTVTLLLGLSMRMFRLNLKFIALSVPEVIWGTQKIGQMDTPTPLCLQNFYGLLLGVSLRMFRPNLKFLALNVPEIIGSTA